MKNLFFQYIVPLLILGISFLFTKLVLYFAKRKNLIDVPNERSSHTIPTPRGGGISILVLFITIGFIINSLSHNSFYIWIGFFVVGVLGFLDDRYHLLSKTRLLIQIIIVAFILFFSKDIDNVSIFGFVFHNEYLLIVVAMVSVVWLTNLYNFMDGIDGLASIQAITLFIGILVLSPNKIFYDNYLIFLFIFVVIGFLLLNWQPAKIFMGDVGSASLGFLFGIWAIYSNDLFKITFTEFHLLLSFFIIDSTITLFRRFVNKEKITEAHRSHFYQRAVQSGLQHQTVSIIVGLLSLNSILGVYFYRFYSKILGIGWIFIPIIIFFVFVEKRKPFKE